MKHFLYLSLAFFLFSCTSKDRYAIDLDDVDLTVKIERFDQEFMSVTPQNANVKVKALFDKYGDFYYRYGTDILGLGTPDSAQYYSKLVMFTGDSTIRSIYDECQLVFKDVTPIEKELTDAFKYVKHYFPDKKIPRIAMHISFFNQSIVATQDILSVSIDNYLGADYAPYQTLAYKYQIVNMEPTKVAPDVFLGYLFSEFPAKDNGTLLEGMLSRAKVLFLQTVFMPNRTEAEIMAYTLEQQEWCEMNEAQMWLTIVENKHLYSSSRMVASKYLNPAPFTVDFTNQSPGQAGIWVGLQIIKSYMAANDEVTIADLMKEEDYQKILTQSKYKP